ncbi:MAG: hypothetical protein ACRDN0_34025 [Trebonia sp.]
MRLRRLAVLPLAAAAMIGTTAAVLPGSAGPAGQAPPMPALTAPALTAWVAERIGWLPAFAAALAGLWLAFRRLEHGRSMPDKTSGKGDKEKYSGDVNDAPNSLPG